MDAVTKQEYEASSTISLIQTSQQSQQKVITYTQEARFANELLCIIRKQLHYI
jgi:hypothetical protein